MRHTTLLIGFTALAACAPKRVHQQPIMVNDDRIGSMDATVMRARDEATADRIAAQAKRDSLTIAATSACSGETCAALARGEVAIGMNEAQVMASTHTTPEAWTIRRAAGATVMVPRSSDLPRDVVGNVATVQLRDGRVSTYSYRESHGLRTITTVADATTEGKSRALAEALIREGDELASTGNLQAALDRYDRASVLRSGDATLDYRIATILDKSLRPVEALIAYQRFLHQLEIEKINAVGDANAKLADAIARARERVIILEKQSK
jgi:hypothetical protein